MEKLAIHTQQAMQAIFVEHLTPDEMKKHLNTITVSCIMAMQNLHGDEFMQSYLQAAIDNIVNGDDTYKVVRLKTQARH